MIKPKTNQEAYALVLETLKPGRGGQSALADQLGVVRQLVSRWDEIPLKYVLKVSEITELPLDWVVPELYSELDKIGGINASPRTLSDLIRLFTEKDSSQWPKTRKPKPRRKS